MEGFLVKISFVALILLANRTCGLRLTNMTAPALQDPRKDMQLHCRFDMGGEDLYAVKWYKDDHEFFRYSPSTAPGNILQFTVAGVRVDSTKTKCMRNGCDLLLTDLQRPQSSGAYRCEVSSEAPAFRLASQTHNVTVAALPEEKPRIEGLARSYTLGDLLTAKCISGLGDPMPTLAWYVNNQQVPSKVLKDIPSDHYEVHHDRKLKLKRNTIQLRLPIDKKLSQTRAKTEVEVSCVSSAEGINPAVAPPLTATRKILVIDPNQMVNNEKLHSLHSSSCTPSFEFALILFLTLTVRWWC